MKYVLLLAGFLYVLAPAQAVASPSPRTDLTVSPAITEWIVQPGDSQTKKILVINKTKKLLPVQTIVQGLTVQETTVGDKSIFDASQWFSISEPDFILRPKQSRTVTITVRPPKNAEPGGHYATVYFRQVAPPALQTSGVAARVGMLGFVVVKGDIRKSLSVTALRHDWLYRGVELTAQLRNTGNVHGLPRGLFIVEDWLGREVERFAVPPGMLLPHTERNYTALWRSPPMGFYTVKLLFSYNGKQQPIVATSVWLFPWQPFVLLLIISTVVWFGVIRVRGRWKRAIVLLLQKEK